MPCVVLYMTQMEETSHMRTGQLNSQTIGKAKRTVSIFKLPMLDLWLQ